MLPFRYQAPTDIDHAALAAGRSAGAQPTTADVQYIAGGTNMTDYMKLGVARPSELVDLTRLDDPALRTIDVRADMVRFGSLVRMSDVEDHNGVKDRLPVVVESLKSAASRQIRNMATLGGNVLQRTRCEYFRETSWPCNKRNPGSGCAAMDGFNRYHAVLGTSDACIATYHGDFAQALIALDAIVEVTGSREKRRLSFADLHRLPKETPQIETNLRADEIITGIIIPIKPWYARSKYLKIRDRQSYAFALASVAIALDLDGEIVREARIGLGGLATIPWRAREAEDALKGKPLDQSTAVAAADAAFASAKPRKYNAFRTTLGRQTLVRALLEVKEMRT
jgi:xanthine dehydrogenase YagS FAD-binding subunit